MADLYHVTTGASLESIFDEGLRHDATIRARQQAVDAAGGEPLDPMAETPAEERADRKAEELIRDARRAADVPSEWPRHADGLFFWPTRAQAVRTAERQLGGSDPIVSVDSASIPAEATPVMGDADRLDTVFQAFWRAFSGRETVTREQEEELYEMLVEWWGDVEPYTGQARRGWEVWVGADVPPEGIERIVDPANDRTLYAPPDDPNQQTFRDL